MMAAAMGTHDGALQADMMKSQERIHRLWNEVAGYPAAEHDAALVHLLAVMSELVHAQNAYWVGSVRVMKAEGDPLFGWRPSRIRNLHPVPVKESVSGQKINESAWNPQDEMVVAHARAAGTFSATRFADVVSEAWFRGPRYQRYVAAGITDAIYVHTPVGTRADSMYCFMRGGGFFSEAERDLAGYAIRGVPTFHRLVMLGHGLLIATAPLAPVERRVVSQLLTDKPEKVIADEMGLAPSTLHTYVRDVLRKFGVSGRVGLIALWLGQGVSGAQAAGE